MLFLRNVQAQRPDSQYFPVQRKKKSLKLTSRLLILQDDNLLAGRTRRHLSKVGLLRFT
jgi:pyrimidine operon attenuation protein/uracil phosphoribosyltransferase